MKAIVFGGTGFIGSHAVEQLTLAGHDVTAAVRESSDTTFLERLGVWIVRTDVTDPGKIGQIVRGRDVAYNCTAGVKLHTPIDPDAEVEICLTRMLVEAAARCDVSRFVQLSTIVVYDFRTDEPLDETYVSQPEYPIQRLSLERERIVEEVGRRTGIETVILRPASAIGARDRVSFFARLFAAHANGRFPIARGGASAVSLVDTRDVGRALAWLGTYGKPEHDNGIYVLKGFDTTWMQLKHAIDSATGKVAEPLEIPDGLTDEQLAEYNLTPYAYKTLTVNRIWKDEKIRRLGFSTMHSLAAAVETAVRNLTARQQG